MRALTMFGTMFGLSLGFVVAAPLAAQSSPALPPPEAAAKALTQCISHTLSQVTIIGGNQPQLSLNGLTYHREPPEFLAATKSLPYGKPEYAQAAVTEGEIWVVGYSGGTCLVISSQTLVPPIEKAYVALFDIPGTWHAEKAAPGEKGERKLQYGYAPTRDQRLRASLSLRDEQGFSMVTVIRVNK